MTPARATLRVGRQRRARRTDETRDLVLDAAEECFTRFGVAQTTIDDVVRVAKVPRATLYRHAGGKHELVAAVAIRRLDQFLDELTRHTARFDTLADALVEGTLFAVEYYRSNDLLARLLAPESGPNGPRIVGDAVNQARDRMIEYVTPLIEVGRSSGTVRPELTPEAAAEWLARMIGSFTLMPSPATRTEADQRALLHLMLVPAFIPDAAR